MLRRKKQRPRFICDRTGFKFPLDEAVTEPGTGLLVHFLESDGEYSLVNHPQNRPYSFKEDQKPLPHATPNDSSGPILYPWPPVEE
jgi:hypothetical protein